MSSFWNGLKKPVYSLAPMEDVTDTAFRELVLGISDPVDLDVLFTEFVSVEGLCHEVGRDRVKHRLEVSENERALLKEKDVKLVAQIWGKDLDSYKRAIEFIEENYTFDGIDINMGCPVPNVVKQGCCSALISTPKIAQELILGCKEFSSLPISVKTRIGFKEVVTEEWTKQVLDCAPTAFTIHGRIQSQMSDGEADWDEIAKSVKVRDEMGLDIPVFGNGDVLSIAQANEYVEKYNVDGVMFGRGIFKNPWLFNSVERIATPEEKIALMWKHALLFEKHWGKDKNFYTIRRFFKVYVTGFAGVAKLRGELMAAADMEHAAEIINRSGVARVTY